jgi:hypothetical protein
MPKYRATLQVSGIVGENPRSVRSALDEQLRKSGLENCRVVRVDVEAPPEGALNRGRTEERTDPTWQRPSNAGGLLLVAAAAWAVWFFWWVLSGPGE